MSGNLLDLPPEEGGPPPEIRQQILAEAARSLEGIVPDEHREDAVRRILDILPITSASPSATGMQMAIKASRHVGPVPAPDDIAEYDQIVPGAANRMIQMAERDQTAFIESNSTKQKLDFAFNIACLFAGLLGLGLILWAIIHLAEGGHDWLGGAVAGIGISGIVTAFVNARHKKPD